MKPTDWAAWVGACSGLGGVCWNIYTKITAGPKLEVSAYAGMVKMPPIPDNPRYLEITVQNRGTSPTSITNVTFHTYASTWDRIRQRNPTLSAVINGYEGLPFPRPLEVGRDWVALVRQEQFEEMLRTPHGLWVAIWHSFSKRPIQVKTLRLGN